MFKIYYFFSISLLLIAFTADIQLLKPKVFVIGDSISIQYGPYLKNSLNGFFEYDRKRDDGQALKDLDNPVGANGGDSKMVLDYLKKLQDSVGFATDYLVINCGLHDIKTKPATGEVQVSLALYKKNLDSIIGISKKLGAELVWINTTPVIDSIHNRKASFHRFSKDVLRYNQEAGKLMADADISVIDLFTFTQKFGPEAYKDHVHFHNEIREKQADFIAGQLVALKNFEK
ncbi:SGNH/GDSL hydrolase family protein [Maribacter sp. 2307ULW6-5]|uniref:SGNH/GDSL hydrolase family protein n=1 Tax=Maribacter sp. 2307ULW6-5 TaxID=3386275 RepID=UPI0039BD8D95